MHALLLLVFCLLALQPALMMVNGQTAGAPTLMQFLGTKSSSEATNLVNQLQAAIDADQDVGSGPESCPRISGSAPAATGKAQPRRLKQRGAPARPVLQQGEVSQVKDIAQMAAVVYCSAKEKLESLACSRCTSFKGDWQNVRVIEDAAKNVRVMVGVRPAAKQIFVSFRGSATAQNWIKNVCASKAALPFALTSGVQAGLSGAVLVHKGFLDNYMLVHTPVISAVNDLVRAHPAFPVVVTGQSMGGSLANLLAVELRSGAMTKATPIDLVTFAAPRTGNAAFAAAVERSAGKVRRYVEDNDMVPHLPLQRMGFAHTKGELYYTGGQVYKCTGQKDKACSNGVRRASLVPTHLQFMGKLFFGPLACSAKTY